MKRFGDWAGYAGLAVLGAAVLLPFAWPARAHFRWWLVGAGVLLVVASFLSRVSDYRSVVTHRSTRYGANTVVAILLVLGVIGFVEALSSRHSARLDLTENRRNSLSPQTVQLLKSLKTEVNAVGFFRGDQPGKRVAEDLFKQYARAAGGKFTWKVVDPDREPALARRYAVESYGTVVLETKTKSEKVTDAEEEKLTNGLVKVTREGKRTVYVLQGHGEAEINNSDRPGFTEAKGALERSNYEVKPLVLAREGKIPDDAAVVIDPGPRTELLAPELDALDAYVGKGGKLFVMVGSGYLAPVQASAWKVLLAKYGLELGDDLVIETNPVGRLFGVGPEVPIVQQYDSHPITRDLGGIMTAFPLSRSIGIARTPPQGVVAQSLAKTSTGSWAETNRDEVQRGQLRMDDKDVKGPVTVAAVATKDKARLVVFGTAALAANNGLGFQGNRDFFLNTVSWLAEEEDQISIRAKDVKQTPVFLSAQQAQAVFLLPVVVLPALVLTGGIVAVVRRRASK